MAGVRSFIAIELSPAVRAALAGLVTRLAQTEADVKWVESVNLHLTLKFLGDVTPDHLTRLTQSLEDLAGERASFALSVGGVGCFPSPAEPHVIWAGLTAGQSDVAALFRAVEGTCAKLGFARERKPFSAHITLGRQRSSHRAAALAEALAGAVDSEGGGFTVSGFTLFRSDLRPTGPVYTAAGTFPFGR